MDGNTTAEDLNSGMPRNESWDTLDRGSSLQIMSISDDNSHISVHEENLAAIIAELEATGTDAVSIVSVVGTFRAGKSFLLDVFLRYLRNTTDEDDSIPAGPDGIPDWLSCGGTQMRLTEGAGEPGFTWRSGRERATTGIWMFSKPFVRTNPETGKQVAVLLMDTQGMFDMKTPPALTAAIFGLSTLISSYQIYNIPRQIQEDTLQQLHFFLEFAQCALREYNEGLRASSEDVDGGRPFQQLEFLVRDWAHFDENWSLNRCIEEMDFVLEDSFVVNVRDAGTREQIKTMFNKITCFLLPHPGTEMTRPNYQGDLSVIEPSFLKLLNVYCHRVLDEGTHAKRIQGAQVTPSSLGHYIRAFTTCFTNGEVPEALTLVEAMTRTTNLCAREKAHKYYREKLEAVCGPKQDYIEEEELMTLHEATQTEAFEMFEKSASFGKQEDIEEAKKELEQEIQRTREQILRDNANKMDQSLVKYAPAVLLIVLAYIVDKLSDITCDWWLDSCVQFSWLLLFVYVGLIGFICFMAYELHKEKGSMAAVNGLMALGQASTKLGTEYVKVGKKHAEELYAKQTGQADEGGAGSAASNEGEAGVGKTTKAD